MFKISFTNTKNFSKNKILFIKLSNYSKKCNKRVIPLLKQNNNNTSTSTCSFNQLFPYSQIRTKIKSSPYKSTNGVQCYIHATSGKHGKLLVSCVKIQTMKVFSCILNSPYDRDYTPLPQSRGYRHYPRSYTQARSLGVPNPLSTGGGPVSMGLPGLSNF